MQHFLCFRLLYVFDGSNLIKFPRTFHIVLMPELVKHGLLPLIIWKECRGKLWTPSSVCLAPAVRCVPQLGPIVSLLTFRNVSIHPHLARPLGIPLFISHGAAVNQILRPREALERTASVNTSSWEPVGSAHSKDQQVSVSMFVFPPDSV